jgi:hypothetical protein
MLGWRASILGELAEPPQLYNLGRHWFFLAGTQIFNRKIFANKKVKLPCFLEPSGFHRWHNEWAVCNEAAAKHERSSTMKKRNIYQNRSQELLSLFEQAGNSSKVMCIPIDFAKKDHMVMFCNGCGDILRKPFSVKNSQIGRAYLTDQVIRFCRHRRIKKNMYFSVAKMPILMQRISSIHYVPKVFW